MKMSKFKEYLEATSTIKKPKLYIKQNQKEVEWVVVQVIVIMLEHWKN